MQTSLKISRGFCPFFGQREEKLNKGKLRRMAKGEKKDGQIAVFYIKIHAKKN